MINVGMTRNKVAAKSKTEKMNTMTYLTKGKIINIFTSHKHEEFIMFEDWLRSRDNHEIKKKIFNSENLQILKQNQIHSS